MKLVKRLYFVVNLLVDWVNYFNGVSSAAFDTKQHHVFTADDIVIVETVEYSCNLSLLLKYVNNEYEPVCTCTCAHESVCMCVCCVCVHKRVHACEIFVFNLMLQLLLSSYNLMCSTSMIIQFF